MLDGYIVAVRSLDSLERLQGIDIEDTAAEGSFVVSRAVEDLGDDNGGSSNADDRPEPAASAPVSSQRDRWIDDCDALDLSLDRERGINNLAELEFIVIGGEGQCQCVYDQSLPRLAHGGGEAGARQREGAHGAGVQ